RNRASAPPLFRWSRESNRRTPKLAFRKLLKIADMPCFLQAIFPQWKRKHEPSKTISLPNRVRAGHLRRQVEFACPAGLALEGQATLRRTACRRGTDFHQHPGGEIGPA